MRDFMFRAWDKEYKCMYQHIENCEGRYECDRCFSWYNCDDRYIIMQYTGLLDKNGKEIYEGDILHYEEYKTRNGVKIEKINDYYDAVVWDDNKCGFVCPILDGKGVHYTSRKIVGNIYEHPTLLQ